MRKRNIRIRVWLNEEESEKLNRHVKKSGLSRENYLRHLINGLIPTDLPPPDYHEMMRQLYAIGNNLNQIAHKAHALNKLDVQRYDQNVAHLEEAIRDIHEAVMLPRQMGHDFCPTGAEVE